ncbi:MAG: ABC transporter permease [candidate division Zixibacteria bacterium]
MLKVLIEKELREVFGSLKFTITFGACAILVILSFYMGASNYSFSHAQYEAAKAQNLKQMEGLTDWASLQNHRIFLPPQPLAALVNGVSNDIGRTIMVEGRGELTAEDSRYNDDPIFAIFRFLDLDFIFGTILSLFAILLGYNSISGEKEQGTLRLALANAIPRTRYILAKLISSAIALVLPLLIAILIGCLILVILRIPFSGEDWLTLILIIITGLLYACVFLTLSIFISALTHRSSNSFLLVLTIWIFGALIVPRASVLLASRTVKVPSVDETTAQKSRYSSQLFKEDKTKMSQFKPSDIDDPEIMVDEFNRFMENIADERDEKMNRFAERINEERSNKLRERQKLSLALARISPTTSMTLAVTTLAGTSLMLKNHYRDEAARYQKSYGDFMKEKAGMNPGGHVMRIKMMMDDEEEPEQINPSELPVFNYKKASVFSAAKTASLDLLFLVIYILLFLTGSFWAFGKYDLR